MNHYPNIRKALAARLWMVHPEKLEEIVSLLEIKLAGGATAPEVLQTFRAANEVSARRADQARATGGAVAVIPVYGLLLHRQMTDISGGSVGTSTTMLSAALRQAVEDSRVSQIVLDIDSPGGDVAGVDELASEIYAARGKKKITAVSNCLCASAAYYLACQASEIVASPSSQTGSIGVYTMHEDASGMFDQMGVKLTLIKYGDHKAEGNNLGPMTDSARAHAQDMVNTYGQMFEDAVARGRRTTRANVHANYGQGRMFDAKNALRIGMVDRIGTLKGVLTKSVQNEPRELAAMRHQLRMAELGATPAKDTKSELERMRRQLEIAGAL